MAESIATIRDRILSNISDSYDKTVGSFMYDVAAAVAIELNTDQTARETIEDQAFLSTAVGTALENKAQDAGLSRTAAVKATTTVSIKGSAASSISVGNLVASDTSEFQATEAITIPAAGTVAVTVDAATDIFTKATHGLNDGDTLQFAGSPLPTGLSALTDYYVYNKTTNTFQVTSSFLDVSTLIDMSTAGSSVTYEVQEKAVIVEALRAGISSNVAAGTIIKFPVTIAGLTAVTNHKAVSNGADAETDAELQTRALAKVQDPPTSGNKAHYREWALEIDGIGNAKTIPLWAGNGTVKVVLIDESGIPLAGGDPLITDVSTNIEANRPIGATVTVDGATALNMTITVNIVAESGYDTGSITTAIETALAAYFAEIALIETSVKYAEIFNIIHDTEGVDDLNTLVVNGGTVNITLADDEVPVLNTFTPTYS